MTRGTLPAGPARCVSRIKPWQALRINSTDDRWSHASSIRPSGRNTPRLGPGVV
jgi:hypothetical protein